MGDEVGVAILVGVTVEEEGVGSGGDGNGEEVEEGVLAVGGFVLCVGGGG
jgi:hypothetical protein